MALVRSFEIPGTGMVVENAYHLISNIQTEKRMVDILPPPDPSRPDGFTQRDDEDESLWINWKAGYIGKISIEVYASKEARDEGKTAIGAIGENATQIANADLRTIFTPGQDFKISFFIDPNSSDSLLTQAYNHLKNTAYYQDATEV